MTMALLLVTSLLQTAKAQRFSRNCVQCRVRCSITRCYCMKQCGVVVGTHCTLDKARLQPAERRCVDWCDAGYNVCKHSKCPWECY